MQKKIIKKKNLLKLIFFSFFLLLSCGKENNNIVISEKVVPLDKLYKSAYEQYQVGNYNEAIDLFKQVETKYAYTEWAPKATLMVMYIYFEGSSYIDTLEYTNKFKKLYPASKFLDYVEFIRALTFYEQINVVSRDQKYAKEAKKIFLQILKNYPNSIYAEESRIRIDLVDEQIAGKEMYIARFYMKKSKWIPAIKRLNNIIENYSTTIYAKEALHRLVEIYYKLGNLSESKKYAAILGYNFNDSLWYKKTYKIVEDKNYKIEIKKEKKKLRDRLKNFFKFSK